MTLRMSLTMKGDKRALAMLKELQRLGSLIKRADLHGKNRVTDAGNSGEVAEYLVKQGRDFFHTQGVADEAAQAFAVAVEQRLGMIKTGKVKAGAVAHKAWLDAMKAAMKQAADNINDGEWTGGGSSELNAEYAKQKFADVGFEYPIGKRKGELLENLAPSNVGNIKLIKGKVG